MIMRDFLPYIGQFAATVLGIWIASSLALRNWRKQQVNLQRHNAAFKCLTGLIQVRNGFIYVRNPSMNPSDAYAIAEKNGEDLNAIEDRIDRSRRCEEIIWNHRYQNLIEPMNTLETAAIELRALVGDDAESFVKPIRMLVFQLRRAISVIITPNRHREFTPDYLQSKRQIVFGVGDSRDPFGEQVNKDIDAALNYFRQFLLTDAKKPKTDFTPPA